MELIMAILLLTILRSLSSWFSYRVAYIISKLFFNANHCNELEKEVEKIKEEQNKISMQEEFAKHAKMERKINKLNIEIEKVKFLPVNFVKDFGNKLDWGLYSLCSLGLFSIVIMYRFQPVLELPDTISSVVLTLAAFPYCNFGQVSCVFWSILCSTGVNRLQSALKSFPKNSKVIS